MATESPPVTVLVRDQPRAVRWGVPLVILAAIFLAAGAVRLSAPPEASTDFKESSPIEIAQAVLHGLACILCVTAMVRSGRRQADFYWWVAPAFITFFMFWREAEIDSDWLGLGENAFTWKYLFEGHMPIWKRLVLGIPSTALAIATLVVCLRHLRLLLETVKRPHVRVTVTFFLLGIGLYALAQFYDRAWYLLQEYEWNLWGVRAHRDDFWEETMELAGAAAILMAVFDAFTHRPIIPGALAKAEAEPLAEP
jgi:hypothetical protein